MVEPARRDPGRDSGNGSCFKRVTLITPPALSDRGVATAPADEAERMGSLTEADAIPSEVAELAAVGLPWESGSERLNGGASRFRKEHA